MSTHSRFEGKIDVLDLLINILKDHEESLSEVVDKLNVFLNNLSGVQKKITNQDQILKQHDLSDVAGKLDAFNDNISSLLEKTSRESTSERGCQVAVVDCRKWSEFRGASKGASLIAFEIDIWNVISITSTSREFIFRYSERLPMSQNDGVAEDSVWQGVFNVDPLSLRRWLSRELNVPEEKIIEGNLLKILGESN